MSGRGKGGKGLGKGGAMRHRKVLTPAGRWYLASLDPTERSNALADMNSRSPLSAWERQNLQQVGELHAQTRHLPVRVKYLARKVGKMAIAMNLWDWRMHQWYGVIFAPSFLRRGRRQRCSSEVRRQMS